MFSGKREKALLEEELAALRETEKRERELLHKIAGQKDTAEEQFCTHDSLACTDGKRDRRD